MTTMTDSDRIREHAERISALEGERIHLATKADLRALEVSLVKWMVGLIFGGMVASAAVASATMKLIG